MDCPDHAGLPVLNRSRAAGRTTVSRAGEHRPLASPVELPLIEQPMTGQEARRLRPSQARPHDCSSTSQDSRRLGREPKTTRRVWIPSLTNGRQPTQSTEAEYPPRAAATATVGQGVPSYGPGRRLSRHPVTYCCRRGTRWADRATTSSASPHSHVHHSSPPSWSGDSDVTQSQAQARRPGGAAKLQDPPQ